MHYITFQEFETKLNNLELQNQSNNNKRSVSIPYNSAYTQNGRNNYSSFDENSNDISRKISQQEERFKMRRFDSTVSNKVKRTFSKDLFTVDRGNLRARVDERYSGVSSYSEFQREILTFKSTSLHRYCYILILFQETTKAARNDDSRKERATSS